MLGQQDFKSSNVDPRHGSQPFRVVPASNDLATRLPLPTTVAAPSAKAGGLGMSDSRAATRPPDELVPLEAGTAFRMATVQCVVARQRQ